MTIFNSIDESFDQTKNFLTGYCVTTEDRKKQDDIKWISHYMDTFYKYAKECTGGHIAEIGVNKVVSSWAWAKARPAKITLCDIHLYERGSKWLESFVELCSDEQIEVVLENKSSLDMELSDVDLLFIDGLHTYEHIKKELEKFSGVVKKYIIFHDINLFEREVGYIVRDFLASTDEWVEVYRTDDTPGISVIERV